MVVSKSKVMATKTEIAEVLRRWEAMYFYCIESIAMTHASIDVLAVYGAVLWCRSKPSKYTRAWRMRVKCARCNSKQTLHFVVEALGVSSSHITGYRSVTIPSRIVTCTWQHNVAKGKCIDVFDTVRRVYTDTVSCSTDLMYRVVQKSGTSCIFFARVFRKPSPNLTIFGTLKQ